MLQTGRILLVSCYELGHQPLAVASAAGYLRRSGFEPNLLDLSVDCLESCSSLPDAKLIALSVPMHTALRVAVDAVPAIRERAPDAHLCFYGLYASLNADYLLGQQIADSVIGGEAEGVLLDLVETLDRGSVLERVAGLSLPGRIAAPVLKRLPLTAPDRTGLPALARYARLQIGDSERLVAAVETSRGCLHTCRHCPIPPVYEGRFFVVPKEQVLQDIRAVVDRGARHLTFADPDFFNGPGHSLAIVREMHAEFPDLTFDITTKIERILRHRKSFQELAACGCLFVVSAMESLSGTVLEHLNKEHTRDDVFAALSILRNTGITLRPTLVAFTPWTTLADYREVIDWVGREGLVHHLDPVQFSIRLLIPPGSDLLPLERLRPHLGPLRQGRFFHEWTHPDPAMDRLHGEVSTIVRQAALAGEEVETTFDRIREATQRAAHEIPRPGVVLPARVTARPPRLTEPWFC